MENDFKAEARREVLKHGIAVDKFLSSDPDEPVFGFNLACAWPFPGAAAQRYGQVAGRLMALDQAAHVYPLWETHITIVTFASFRLHRKPTPDVSARLQLLIKPVVELIGPRLEFPAFELVLGQPVLAPNAVVLPITDSPGSIMRIRQTVREALAEDKALLEELVAAGLNVPGIVHSTIMRFKSKPADLGKFIEDFDRTSAACEPFSLTVNELIVTTETKPYMRGGEIVHRFPLAPASGGK